MLFGRLRAAVPALLSSMISFSPRKSGSSSKFSEVDEIAFKNAWVLGLAASVRYFD